MRTLNLMRWPRKSAERVVRLASAREDTHGRALLSYLAPPVARYADSGGHTNAWESREIALQLSQRGLDVDVINFDDSEFVPSGPYDVVVGLHSELARLAAQAEARISLMHHTGAHPSFQNAAERRRIEELEERRGVRCVPRRMVDEGPIYDEALKAVTASSLLGNEWTLSTYPRDVRRKITCIPATGARVAKIRSPRELLPAGREFLWFAGSGAVHKGLDRLLEAFAGSSQLVLHVVGNVESEHDFLEAYRRELFELPNIHWHGYLDPMSRKFRRVVRGCFCVVAPTCSEGTSPATVTMLQLGLFPLISRESGISLPPGAGDYLQTCSVEEIEGAVADLHAMPAAELVEQMRDTQSMALERHSRRSFCRAYGDYLRKVLGPEPDPDQKR